MSSLPEDLESYGYKENAAKTFERLIQPKKKHIYSGTALDVDARHDEQKCYLIYSDTWRKIKSFYIELQLPYQILEGNFLCFKIVFKFLTFKRECP